MNIPSKVRVGSIDYDVELTDETLVFNTQQSLGIIDYDNNKIRIANNIQSNQRQEQTFLHELVHAVTREFKIDFTEDEETIVDKLADGLHQVIRDNLPNTVKVGDIAIADGIDFEKVYEEFSKKMSGELREALRGEKDNETIVTLKDVLKLGSYEEIVKYFKKENKNIFIKSVEVTQIAGNHQEAKIVYYDGISKCTIAGQGDIPLEKRLKLPICTPIKTVLEIMNTSRENCV